MFVFTVVVITLLSGRSIRCQSNHGLRVGDPERLENVLRRALGGRTLRLAVIGGSNSAGGGIEKDESSLDGLYYNVFARWWGENIEKKTGAGLRRQILAIGGTGSYFFAFCHKNFIQKSPDIVLVEQSVNFNTVGKAEPLEQLTRRLLDGPSKPAVIFIDLFSGMGTNPDTGRIGNPKCTNLEDYGQTEIERHYRITSISLRDMICPVSQSGQRHLNQTDMSSSDGKHVGIKGHALVAKTLISYVWKAFENLAVAFPEAARSLPTIPRPLFVKLELEGPSCWTHATPNGFRSFDDTLDVKVIFRRGFRLTLDKLKGSALRTDTQGGYTANRVGSTAVFRVRVPSNHGQLRSLLVLIRTNSNGGKARVWLDGDSEGAVTISNKSQFGQNQLFTVSSRVTPGYHNVMVKLVGSGYFMVSGLLVGPPDLNIERGLWLAAKCRKI